MSVTAAAALAEPAASSTLPPPIGNDHRWLETRFGPIRLDPERLLSFPAGMPGFPGCHRFQLERMAGSPLLLLQSMDDGELAFFVMPLPEQPPLIKASDRIATCRLLSLDYGSTDYLAIVTARQSPAGLELHANLRAPLVIDTRRRIGAQVVLADAGYPLRHRVLPTN